MTRVSRSCRKKLLPVPERCAWEVLPKLRPMAPSTWSIGVPSWVPDEKYSPRRFAFELSAGRLEDAVEEMNNSPFQRAELCRKAEDGNAGDRIGLFLKAVGHLLAQAFYQRIEFGRGLADHVPGAIRGLECRAPYLASARFVESAESTP